MEPIIWFAELHRTDADVAGGKGANLGELVSRRLPGPARVRRDGPGLSRLDGGGRGP